MNTLETSTEKIAGARPDLSIVIVNWNSCSFLRACLASVYRHVTEIKLEVIVVDNASFDGSGEMIESEFPQVRFAQSHENLGFARANNLGFALSRGRNVLFLNPDTEIIGPAVNAMLTFLESTSDAGAVGCRLLNSDGSIQTSSIKKFPSLTSEIFDIGYLQRKFHAWPLFGIAPLFHSGSRPQPVDAVSGACLLARRSVFEGVGFFTTEYFMYSEDVDLCYKIRKSGTNVYYLGDANVVHHGGQSSASQAPHFAAIMMRKSRMRFFEVRQGRLYAAAYRLLVAMIACVRMALLGGIWALTAGRFSPEWRAAAYGKWCAVFRWAMGWEHQERALEAPANRQARAEKTPVEKLRLEA